MGSSDPGSATEWTTGRILRLVVPPLVVLSVALALREPAEKDVPAPSRSNVSEPALQVASEARILLLAKDASGLAEALRARLGPGIDLILVPESDLDRLAKEYGVAQFPAVVVEQSGRKPSVYAGDAATPAAVVKRCRELGLPLADKEP